MLELYANDIRLLHTKSNNAFSRICNVIYLANIQKLPSFCGHGTSIHIIVEMPQNIRPSCPIVEYCVSQSRLFFDYLNASCLQTI